MIRKINFKCCNYLYYIIILSLILFSNSVYGDTYTLEQIRDIKKIENDKRNAEIEKMRIEDQTKYSIPVLKSRAKRSLNDIAIIQSSLNENISDYNVQVKGEVRNNGNERVNYVRVYCVALDISNNIIGVGYDYIDGTYVHQPYSDNKIPSYPRNGLNPGETDYFRIYMNLSGTQVNSVQYFIDGDSPYGTIIPLLSHVELNGTPTKQEDSSGKLVINGQLKNSGSVVANSIYLHVISKDASGKIIDIDSNYGIVGDLEPGVAQSFNATTYATYSDVATVEYKISWRESGAANAGEDQIVGNSVTLNAGQSYEGNGAIYNWTLKHRESEIYNQSVTGKTPSVTNLQPGFYDVELSLTDNDELIWTDTLMLVAAGAMFDVDDNKQIGLPEAIRALQIVAGMK